MILNVPVSKTRYDDQCVHACMSMAEIGFGYYYCLTVLFLCTLYRKERANREGRGKGTPGERKKRKGKKRS